MIECTIEGPVALITLNNPAANTFTAAGLEQLLALIGDLDANHAVRAAVISGAKYPDFGCNFEVFTNPDYLELETLGPLVELGAGRAVEHVEHWWLFADVPRGENEAWIDTAVVPLIQKTGREQ